MSSDRLPGFRSSGSLRDHILRTMACHEGRCPDPAGGFFHCVKDDGSDDVRSTRHLVRCTRVVVTQAMAARRFPELRNAPAWRDTARSWPRPARHAAT